MLRAAFCWGRVGGGNAGLCAAITALLTIVWTFHATDWPAQHRGVNQAEKELIGSSEIPDASASGSRTAGWSTLLRNRSLLLITLSYAAVGYFQYLFVYWMQFYFDKVLSLAPTPDAGVESVRGQ